MCQSMDVMSYEKRERRLTPPRLGGRSLNKTDRAAAPELR